MGDIIELQIEKNVPTKESQLETSLKSTQISQSPQTFSLEQAVEILSKAEKYQELSRESHATKELIEKYRLPSTEGLTLPLIQELAKASGINQKYIDKIINCLYPSREQQIEDIINFKSKPSCEAITEYYYKNLKSFIENHPIFKGEIKYYPCNSAIDFFNLEEKVIASRFPFLNLKLRKIITKKYLGELSVYKDNIKITARSPLLNRIFGEKIIALNNEFKYLFKQFLNLNFYHEYSV